MSTIDLRCQPTAGGWACHVTVQSPDSTQTTHEVKVAWDDLSRLAPGAHDPADLVRRSFAFLLGREPKESILRRFDLSAIGRYYPDYESVIRR